MSYRKIWEKHYGPIPKDDQGRSYEIHHIDKNRKNNSIENLQCVSIKEHYDIHYNQGDFWACVMIGKRMLLTPEEISNIQRGRKRPGIGGVKKGQIPWNKGKPGYKCKEDPNRKNKQCSTKLNYSEVLKIRELYEKRLPLETAGKIMRNGKVMSYEQAFSIKYAPIYDVSIPCIKNIVLKKSWGDNVKIKHKI